MIYVITGHLGSGKSLLAIRIAHDYLRAGKRVASNITLFLDHLLPAQSRTTIVKLPYIVAEPHLEALGTGYDGPYDESKFGLIILDEAGKWLNSRDWQDKERRGLFNWITHARKLGWDVALIVQDYEALDAQIRRAVTEMYVHCSRLDRIKVPFLPLKMPRYHVAKGLYGGPNGALSQRWFAKGDDYFKAYDTREAVRPEQLWTEAGPVDMRANFSLLSAWHLVGRYLPSRPPWWVYGVTLLKWILAWPTLFLVGAAGRSPAGAASSRPYGLRADLARLFPALFHETARQLVPVPAVGAQQLTKRQMLDHSRTALQLRDVTTARRWLDLAARS